MAFISVTQWHFCRGIKSYCKTSTIIQNCGDNECKINTSYCPNRKRNFSNIFAIIHYYILTYSLTHSVRKNLTKNASGQNHRSLWFTLESFSPIIEITKIYQLQIFSYLFTFYSSLSRICWKNKCYKKQVPSKIFTLLRCLKINFCINFHNQLKKVWNVNFWGQNSGLNFHQISKFYLNCYKM